MKQIPRLIFWDLLTLNLSLTDDVTPKATNTAINKPVHLIKTLSPQITRKGLQLDY